MPISLNSIFGVHEKALLLREQRSEIIANNLANADTPNYKARDLDFKQAMQQFSNHSLQLSTSDGKHVSSSVDQSFESLKYRIPKQASLDGNTVDKNTETTAFARNAFEYQASLNFLGGNLRTIMMALKGE